MSNPLEKMAARVAYWKTLGWKLVYEDFASVWKVGHYQVVQTSDSVGFFVYNIDTEQVLLARQKRDAMVSPGNPSGIINEVPAGRFDYNADPRQLIVDEALQEIGATITYDDIIPLNGGRPLALSPGIITEKMYLAIVLVSNNQIDPKKNIFGVVEEGEWITRYAIAVSELDKYFFDDMKTFALYHFFRSYIESQFKLVLSGKIDLIHPRLREKILKPLQQVTQLLNGVERSIERSSETLMRMDSQLDRLMEEKHGQKA